MQPAAQTERESRVGKRLVPLPKGVNVAINGRNVKIEGPKGKLALDLPPQVTAKKDGEALKVESSAGGRDARRLQGLGRALLSSMVKGASVGYEKILELVGTGYSCEVKGKTIVFQVGLSHPATIEIPASVSSVVPPDSKGTQLVLTSPDKA